MAQLIGLVTGPIRCQSRNLPAVTAPAWLIALASPT
jgi:hypothetical protein